MKMVNLRRLPAGVNLQGASFMGGMADVNDHVARVTAGGGTGANSSDLFKIYRFLHSQGLLSGTRLLWTPESGYVQRTDGVLKYCRTGFDTSLYDNDLDGSATASQQPRLVGGIAPNSKPAASNQNGEARYFTHTPISFAATDAWSVTMVLNWDGNNESFIGICGNGINPGNSHIAIRRGGLNKWAFFNNTPSGGYIGVDNTSEYIGKKIVVTFIASGGGNIKVFVGGVEKGNLNITTNIGFSKLFTELSDLTTQAKLKGSFSAYHIQSSALTPAQVLSEYNLLRSMYPEIESVDIGTQTWATRNFEAVATPQGNVIPEMQTNAAVEKITQPVNLNVGWNTLSAIIDSNNGFNTVATSLGGVRWINNITIGKWYKLTYSANSSLGLRCYNSDGAVNLISAGVGTVYFKAITDDLYFRTYGPDTITNFSVSCQELGWANSTEIYDAVYAATSGDAATKEYAALKEAAMWCYYNNSADNGAIYGKLYNWYAAKLLDLDMVTAGFCWRVPTSAQFTTLATYLGGTSVAGGKMKMTGTDYWNTPNTGATNESGFTALATGIRTNYGNYSSLKTDVFIGAIDNSGTNRTSAEIKYNLSTVSLITSRNVGIGTSIRLIKV